MIRFEVVKVGTGGGVRCSRCAGVPEPAVYDTVEDIRARIGRAVESWDDLVGPNVELAGAEPFGHPDLPEIVAAATRGGVRRLRLATDGVALQSPTNCAGALSAGVRHISFSLLGGTMGVHDVLAGEPGAFEATLAGIGTYRGIAERDGVTIAVRAVIPACRHNLHDLPQAAGAAVEAGAHSISIQVEETGAELTGAIPWIEAACDTGVTNGVWVEVSGVPFCLIAGYELHSSDVMRERAGAMAPVCASCPLSRVCCGGPEGSGGDLLAAFAPPLGADRLARSIARAREGAGRDA